MGFSNELDLKEMIEGDAEIYSNGCMEYRLRNTLDYHLFRCAINTFHLECLYMECIEQWTQYSITVVKNVMHYQ